MRPASDTPPSDPARDGDPPVRQPAPTGDPLIDEVRALKYELSARFGHDIERLGDHLKALQEDIARRDPRRVVRQPRPEP